MNIMKVLERKWVHIILRPQGCRFNPLIVAALASTYIMKTLPQRFFECSQARHGNLGLQYTNPSSLVRWMVFRHQRLAHHQVRT
jgi:hypothetical protein